MCGRYVSARKHQDLLEEFQVQADHVAEPLEPDYNVAPTKNVYAVLTRRERGPAPEDDAPGRAGPASVAGVPDAAAARDDAADRPVTRQLRVLRWGLVPSWAKDLSLSGKLINARAETVAVKPSFRQAFARRRCLLPADGYYEWQAPGGAGSGGRVRKQPFYMSARDGRALALAGLYELRRMPDLPADHPDAWLWTTTIITTRATDDVGHIHDRMPMIIEPGNWARWLDPARTGPDDLSGLLVPAASAGLDIWPVSPAVNNVRNNGPGLIDPAPPGEDPAEAPASLF
jgi:putative SOS response-associated peptidase YedK